MFSPFELWVFCIIAYKCYFWQEYFHFYCHYIKTKQRDLRSKLRTIDLYEIFSKTSIHTRLENPNWPVTGKMSLNYIPEGIVNTQIITINFMSTCEVLFKLKDIAMLYIFAFVKNFKYWCNICGTTNEHARTHYWSQNQSRHYLT